MNGCETHTDVDDNNCGTCGNKCTGGQTCVAGSCQGGSSGTCTAGASGKPNVVLIMMDDLDVTSFNTLLDNGLLPNIKTHIVDTGVRFTESYVGNALCGPSRASMLTGQYSHNNGCRNNAGAAGAFKPHDGSTLGTYLKAAGYRTAYFGKYINGYGGVPYHAPGWDEWQVFKEPTVYYMWGYTLVKSIDNSAAVEVQYNGGATGVPATNADATYQTNVLAGLGQTFVTTAVQPFGMVVMPLAPHVEVLPGQSLANRTDMRKLEVRPARSHFRQLRGADDCTPISATYDLPHKTAPSYNEADITDKPQWLKTGITCGGGTCSYGGGGWPLLTTGVCGTSGDVQFQTRQHLDRLESILSVDDMVGTIWNALNTRGVASNTVFIVTGDNGFLLGEHRLNNKMFPYEESIHVPLVASCNATSGTTDSHYVSNIDLAPTIMDYAQAPLSVDGRSWRSILEGAPPATWRKRLLVEHWIDPNSPYPWQEAADHALVRTSVNDSTPQHLYVGYYGLTGVLNQSSSATELEEYDIPADQWELTNVSTNAAYTTQRADLAPKLQSLRTCANASCQTAEN
jgi:arylsulfatase A-like enzyme